MSSVIGSISGNLYLRDESLPELVEDWKLVLSEGESMDSDSETPSAEIPVDAGGEDYRDAFSGKRPTPAPTVEKHLQTLEDVLIICVDDEERKEFIEEHDPLSPLPTTSKNERERNSRRRAHSKRHTCKRHAECR